MAAGLTTSFALEITLLHYGSDALSWSRAAHTAAGMSLLSMLAMELTENLVTLGLTAGSDGAMMSTMSLTELRYWGVTAVAMLAGFLVPLPYNYFRLKAYGKACH